jgi:hypothetical protein
MNRIDTQHERRFRTDWSLREGWHVTVSSPSSAGWTRRWVIMERVASYEEANEHLADPERRARCERMADYFEATEDGDRCFRWIHPSGPLHADTLGHLCGRWDDPTWSAKAQARLLVGGIVQSLVGTSFDVPYHVKQTWLAALDLALATGHAEELARPLRTLLTGLRPGGRVVPRAVRRGWRSVRRRGRQRLGRAPRREHGRRRLADAPGVQPARGGVLRHPRRRAGAGR